MHSNGDSDDRFRPDFGGRVEHRSAGEAVDAVYGEEISATN
jgi:hypothetical protein